MLVKNGQLAVGKVLSATTWPRGTGGKMGFGGTPIIRNQHMEKHTKKQKANEKTRKNTLTFWFAFYFAFLVSLWVVLLQQEKTTKKPRNNYKDHTKHWFETMLEVLVSSL